MVASRRSNRAKCKLCQTIIESLDYVKYTRCECGEIYVGGGDKLYCGANNWSNFLRLDEEGNEIEPTVSLEADQAPQGRPTRQDLLKMLSEMIDTYEKGSEALLQSQVTHYDLWSSLLLVQQLFLSFDADASL